MTATIGGHPVLLHRSGVHSRGLATRAWVTAGLLAGTAWVGIGNPNQGAFFPRCIFLQTTGHWCPGCGGLRATHDLLHGDFAGAMGMNAVVTLIILPLGVVGLGWWWLQGLGVKMPAWKISTRVAWILPVLLIVFWVLRNIPMFEPYLAP
jgi:hypothetical protein